MLLRDKCRKQKKFVEYKQQRNYVNYLVKEAKKKYFNDLAGNKADISCMWRATNTLTKGHSPVNNNLPSELTPDVFNAHFVSVVSKFLPDDQTDGSQYNCPDRLLNFCSDRISQNTTFSIPPISVFETKTPPFKSKVRDHANRASFKTSPTWNNCRRAAKVANAY